MQIRWSYVIIMTSMLATKAEGQCGGDSGYCCLSECGGSCVNGIGEQMCIACPGNCDLTVCPCGCQCIKSSASHSLKLSKFGMMMHGIVFSILFVARII